MSTVMVVELGINLFLVSSAILLFLLSLILYTMRLPLVRRLALLSVFILSCSLWFLTQNQVVISWFGQRDFFQLVNVFCQYGITFFSLTYVREFTGGWRRKLTSGCQLWTLLFIVAVSILHRTTTLEYSDFLTLGAVCNAVFIALMVVGIGWEAFLKKSRDARELLLSSIPILVGGALEICNFISGSALPTAIPFFVGFIFFMLLQVYWFVWHLREHLKRTAQMEQELMDSRIAVMLSQIQPHFLYNSLLGIKQLCDTQPKKASEALDHFAYYLRGNLYFLSNQRLIPFEKEMEHVKDYLYLEKMRFGEKVNARWEIGCTDFLLPSLTLQTLVENAVRHGLTKKKGGGSITIKSELTQDAVLIAVADDGVGFDTTAAPDNDRPHIGIENVRKRVEMQCGGTLQIHSRPGLGTEVKIILPRREEG